jgi:hypothetical protein
MVSYSINVLFGWLDAQNGAITSVATVFIAVFTIVLAVVSRRQTKIISDQLKLASDEFAVTHRPRIVVRGFTMMQPELTIGEHRASCSTLTILVIPQQESLRFEAEPLCSRSTGGFHLTWAFSFLRSLMSR